MSRNAVKKLRKNGAFDARDFFAQRNKEKVRSRDEIHQELKKIRQTRRGDESSTKVR